MIIEIHNKLARIIAIFLLALALSGSPAWAEDLGWAEDVQLVINELKVFPVFKLIRVAVGDPEVADVTILSNTELMLIAKKEGATSLIIWDESGQRSYNITVIGQNLEKVAQRIRGLLASSDIRLVKIKTEEDKIYAMGDVLTQDELDRVADILAPFPGVINLVNLKERQPLVEIDVRVLEVAFTDAKKLGLDWSNSLPITYTEPSSPTEGDVPKLWKVVRWDRTTINAKLNFLIEEDKARTLANPKLVTLSGKEASFLVGGEVPYITVETEGRTRVEWKDYGVNLKILPLVNAKNEIRARIEAEVSDLGSNITESGYAIPSITTRKAQTELFLNEEDTIFIAGLIKNYDNRDVARLPWLSKVPILGEMFKYSYLQDRRTELVISLTPRIIGEKATPEYISHEMLNQEAMLKAKRNIAAYGEEYSPFVYYSHMIEDIITRSVVYPDRAQEQKQEGIVKIDLLLLSNGQLKEVKIKESSGSEALDEAVLSAVQEQSPYPSFPSQITQEELRLIVPVVFKSYAKNE